ncbi:MAG: type II toxin-antitoxin system RelE/ParE family toxin [Trueperaceae bacterium]|nr:type II toxin-antitoxin system RelE/ParE family toxin [Trueperaceae bacterium]
MRTARLRRRAERDLIDIWHYTAERWNEDQADAYLDVIGLAIQQLVLQPEMGVRRDGVRDGYRVFFVDRHAIYYRITPSAVQIVRVLHDRMDPHRHM